MIAPTADQQAAVKPSHVARGFPDAGDHAEGAGQLAVPSLQRVQSSAAVAPFKPIVAAGHDLNEPAGRTAVGVVVHRPKLAGGIRSEAEGVPKSAGVAGQVAALTVHFHDGPGTTIFADLLTVGSLGRPGLAEVFADPEVDRAVGRDGQTVQAIVGVIALGGQLGQRNPLGGRAIRVLSDEPENLVPGRTTIEPSRSVATFIISLVPS